MKTFLVVLGFCIFFVIGCANPPPPPKPLEPIVFEKESPPAQEKKDKVEPIIKNNVGVTIKVDPKTGIQELIVDPFPEEDIEKK